MCETGPRPKFSSYHLWKVLRVIENEGPIGRKRLTKKVGIGEGSIRTILNILRENRMIESRKEGESLLPKGEEAIKKFPVAVKIEAGNLTVKECDVAVLVRDKAHEISKGQEERDEAIKAGASGATTLIFKNRKLVMPEGVEIEREYPEVAEQIFSLFELREDDVIIIGTAESEDKAEEGAVTAALKLLKF